MESIELVRVMWNPARPNNFETHSRYIGPKTSSNAVAMAARAALEEMVEKSCLDRDEAKRQIMNKVALALRGGIPFEVQHNHTTADAPETVRFVRQEFARLEALGVKCTINYPAYKGKRTSMWSLIPQKLMPPTRIMRYCCAVLKEQGGNGRFITTGVRWAESSRRKRDRGVFEAYTRNKENKIVLKGEEQEPSEIFEGCKVAAKRVVNPIVDWTDNQVWSFLQDAKVPVNPLYECGLDRVGCIGCPLAKKSKRYAEFRRWPAYEKLYIQAFDRMLDERRARGKLDGNWMMGGTGKDVFRWWMQEDVLPGQISVDDILED